jgi:hypothetical protein
LATPAAGEKFELTGKIFWVVTCGDLTGGHIKVWTPKENTIEYFSLNS